MTENLEEQVVRLDHLLTRLKGCVGLDRLAVLDSQHEVQAFLKRSDFMQTILEKLSVEEVYLVKCILAIGQGSLVFHFLDTLENPLENVKQLVRNLVDTEKFYEDLGGIIGYHVTVLKLLLQYRKKKNGQEQPVSIRYSKPEGFDLTVSSEKVREAIAAGIKNLPEVAEMYPVGGAGDRLMLRDEKTDALLPAALLRFNGRYLLEGLIRDLQAKEYLYEKIFGEQLFTPIALMTSEEKNNEHHIRRICEKSNWFGRPKDSFFFFKQPLTPVITKEGDWAVTGPLKILLKPGGHGVLWKLARDKGVYDWLKKQNYDHLIVRQINNPIAGVDLGLLALAGIGCRDQKAFGFASCERLLNATEGMDVLVEKKWEKEFDYCISNIEYTEFEKLGISDAPLAPGSPYSIFPANTNILFGYIPSIQEAIAISPLPGLLLNMKNKVSCLNSDGEYREIEAGRLETTMQNIADVLVDHFSQPITSDQQKNLKTFLTYNHRRKTISVTKNAYKEDKSLQETPEGAFYDLLQNHRELLSERCQIKMPELNSQEDYLKNGPSFVVRYHPALGPLYSIISQKIQGGILSNRSELDLEIAELEMKDLQLEGSFLIQAKSPLGKCQLYNVKVKNKGIDWKANNRYWRNEIVREERLLLLLHGTAEFYAKDIVLEGNQRIEVQNGYRMIASKQGEKVHFELQKIAEPTWSWKYRLDANNNIILNFGGR